MSLIGKLEEVDIGDIITLNTRGQLEVTGYVHEYSQKKIRLSTTNPYNNTSNTRFWAWIHIGEFNNTKTYKLKHFDEYTLLRKHNPE